MFLTFYYRWKQIERDIEIDSVRGKQKVEVGKQNQNKRNTLYACILRTNIGLYTNGTEHLHEYDGVNNSYITTCIALSLVSEAHVPKHKP